MKGFFNESQLLQIKASSSTVPKCGACGFFKHCNSPKLGVQGKGRKGILIVNPFPGSDADKEGRHMSNVTSKFMRDALLDRDIDLVKDCWITSALICHPSKSLTTDHINYCQPNLIQTIKDLEPKAIVLLGYEAIMSLLKHTWKNDIGLPGKWIGYLIPDQALNSWILPIYAPSHILVNKETKNPVPEVITLQMLDRLVEVVDKRPWNSVPDYKKDILTITDDVIAARSIKGMIREGLPIAYDYEANMKKPEGKGARLYSCSLSNANRTIAYLMHGKAIDATQRFLESDVPKYCHNGKYEDRWNLNVFGFQANRFVFDTMIGAHLLDPRQGTKSLKFQSYVQMGQAIYNDHIDSFLRSDGSMSKNKIKQADVIDILLYNGLDALLTRLIADVQMKKIGVRFDEGD